MWGSHDCKFVHDDTIDDVQRCLVAAAALAAECRGMPAEDKVWAAEQELGSSDISMAADTHLTGAIVSAELVMRADKAA